MSSENDVAYIDSIVPDQGNGGSFCSNCDYDLSKFVCTKLTMPEKCPGCGKELVWGGIYAGAGGSDF